MGLIGFMCLVYIFIVASYFFLQYRNNLVYKYRIDCVHKNLSAYDELPSYENMVYSFIKWPASKLKKGYVDDQENT